MRAYLTPFFSNSDTNRLNSSNTFIIAFLGANVELTCSGAVPAVSVQ